MSRHKPIFTRPHAWLTRAKARATAIMELTEICHPADWRLTDRAYHERTISMLNDLDHIDPVPNGQDDEWAWWIICSVRLEGTCEDLGLARLLRA